jgi:hypothetical protein
MYTLSPTQYLDGKHSFYASLNLMGMLSALIVREVILGWQRKLPDISDKSGCSMGQKKHCLVLVH